jgi:hypothetical protein
MKLKRFLFLLPIFFISLVSADCSITNLADCISESIFNFLLGILNAPIQPLLNMIYSLLTQPVNIDIFSPVWATIIYILSMFYGILLMYAGFRFILSGYSVEQREKAKSTLTNIIVMMVLVQASYYIYSLAIEVSSSVTTVILNMVQQSFFLLTIDNITNIGLQFAFAFPYTISLLITLIILVLRYMIVSIGIILFPIGIFFYFIGPFNNFGRLLINFLFSTMALTFFYAVIFLASANLLNAAPFQNIKILVMIGAFALVNIITICVGIFVLIKSATKVAAPVMQVVSVVGAGA